MKRHPIRVVSRRTGLSRDVLRAWEIRYGLLDPQRSAGGQRLYSDADIERLHLIRRALEAGRRIGQVARLPVAELERLVAEDARADRAAADGAAGFSSAETLEFLDASLEALESFQVRGLETVLNRAAASLPVSEFIDHVLTPLLIAVGDLWAAGRITPGHERAASTVVRRKLDQLRSSLNNPHGPVLVVATPAGQRHEIGAMLAAAAAAAAGWRAVYLGPDLPAESIARAVTETSAMAVALSVIFPPDDPSLDGELRELRSLLPDQTPIIVGGSGAASYQMVLEEIDAVWLPNEPSVRGTLDWVRLSHETRGLGAQPSE